MNRLAIILFIFACIGPVKGQYDWEGKERDRMFKAKVKTQTQWTHDYVSGKPSAQGYKSSVTNYNTKGDVVEIYSYNEEGKIISLVTYQYDSNGNKISFERYQGNREKLQYSQKTVIDAKGVKSKETGFDGTSMYSNTYRYDGNGKLIEITYMTDNALIEKRKLKYTGGKTEIEIYNASNVLTHKQQNIYNAQGKLIEEVKTGGSGNIVHTVDIQYNPTGSILEETRKRAGDQLDYQKLYQYDNVQRPVKEETINLDGTKFISHEYTYNNLGDLTLEKWMKNSRSKEPSTKKYTYNAKGIYTEVDCYFATYKLNTLYKYQYEFY